MRLLSGGVPIQNFVNVAGPAATVAGVWIAWHFGTKRAKVDVRQVTSTERDVANTEIDIALSQGAKLRDELRITNAAQQQTLATQQTAIAALSSDNTDMHIKVHDLNNKVMALSYAVTELTEQRDECRSDLAEVLARVVALEQAPTIRENP